MGEITLRTLKSFGVGVYYSVISIPTLGPSNLLQNQYKINTVKDDNMPNYMRWEVLYEFNRINIFGSFKRGVIKVHIENLVQLK